MKDTMAEYAVGMGKRALAAVRREFKARKVDVAKILNHDDEVALIINAMEPTYLSILKTEGVSAAALVGAAFDENEKRMRRALEDSIALMADNYSKTTLAALEDALNKGLAEGGTLDDLTEYVQEIAVWSTTSRAKTVARTEAFRTANFATKEAWKQSGVVEKVKWYTADDEACEFCDAMAKEPAIPIDEVFKEIGDTVIGTEGGVMTVEYADIEGGSLHVNCRCSIAPASIHI
jgi:hypothetical protein